MHLSQSPPPLPPPPSFQNCISLAIPMCPMHPVASSMHYNCDIHSYTLICMHTVWIPAFILALLCANAESQVCTYQQKVCECPSANTECYFTLVVEQLLTLTSYRLVQSSDGNFIRELNGGSWSYTINETGQLVPIESNGLADVDVSECRLFGEQFLQNNCSIPMTTDSLTFGEFYAINGILPGPTMVVYQDQTISIKVVNNLFNEEVTIHWHGIHQVDSPWMDGVNHITQCPIPTHATFNYIFKASPSGTMWYHSHVGTQRGEGLFGSLIIRESQDMTEATKQQLQRLLGEPSVIDIVDDPAHTVSLLDWQRDLLLATLTFLSNQLITFDINDQTIETFTVPRGPAGGEVSRIPYWAGLINGLGRQKAVPYKRSRLSVFNIDYKDDSNPRRYYRFRLVGAQNRFMYRFSIAEHQLIVIATDGYLTEPKVVDYILIHTGERYDFLLNPKRQNETIGKDTFLILAETVQTDPDTAEAFLHYGTGSVPTTSYGEIVQNTVARNCNTNNLCKALNCPFERYSSREFINCIPVTELQLLFPTELEKVPLLPDDDHTEFFDFAFTGSAESAAVNGRNFRVPSGSLQTQSEDLPEDEKCALGTIGCTNDLDLNPCICTHIVDIDDSYTTIQFVLTAIGDGGRTYHPIHLHGHSFHVAGIFYGESTENDTSGEISVALNQDVTCNNDIYCTDPGWAGDPVDGTVTSRTVRKDTIVVPAKGYVVIRFIADNWGYWYLHCHIESHLVEGMSVVINEVQSRHNPPPDRQVDQQCGNFNWTVDEFNEHVGGATALISNIWLLILPLATCKYFA